MSVSDLSSRFNSTWTPEPFSGCHLWTGYNKTGGYGAIKCAGKDFMAHRVSWELRHGTIPEGKKVCHKCDTPSCVNPDHLFLGTQADNIRDCVLKKRFKSNVGKHNPRAKLGESDVLLIRTSKEQGTTLARRFGIGTTAVSRIRSGKTWRSVRSLIWES